MSGVLEQEEIDALMGGLQSGEVEAGTDQPGATAFARYDFAKQDYAIRRLIPAIAVVQTQFADAIKSRVGALVPGLSEVAIDKLAVMKWDELLRTLEPPCGIAVVQAPPLAAPMFLAFESALVFDLVDRYFGGRQRLLKTRTAERFSGTELRFLETLGEALLPDLAGAWQSVLNIQPTLSTWHGSARHVEELAEGDTLIASRLAVSLGELGGGLWVMVPWSALEAVRDRLGGPARSARRERDGRWRDKLRGGVEDSALEVIALLSEQSISLKQASQLKVGDILSIDSPESVELHIDDIPVMRGSFGTHEGQMAVKVAEITLRPPRTPTGGDHG